MQSFTFDGEVVTEEVEGDGGEKETKVALTIVDYKQFLDTYEKDNRESFEAAKYPDESPLNSIKWTFIEYKSKVCTALGMIGQKVGDANVVCRLKPKRGAIALEHFSAGGLVLVPMSGIIKVEKVGSEEATSMMSCGGSAPDGYTMVIAPQSEFPCPAWFVQPTDDESKANVEIAKRPITVQTKFPGRSKVGDTSTIEIPVFVNSKDVEKGHELLFYKAAKPKGGSKRAFVMVGGASSSAKVVRK